MSEELKGVIGLCIGIALIPPMNWLCDYMYKIQDKIKDKIKTKRRKDLGEL